MATPDSKRDFTTLYQSLIAAQALDGLRGRRFEPESTHRGDEERLYSSEPVLTVQRPSPSPAHASGSEPSISPGSLSFSFRNFAHHPPRAPLLRPSTTASHCV